MSVHSTITGSTGGNHIPHNWTFATSTARASATDPNTSAAYASTALGKVALQSDTNQFWLLTAITPTWVAVGVPILTTSARDALTPTEGLLIYNSTTHKLNVRVAAAWEVVTSV